MSIPKNNFVSESQDNIELKPDINNINLTLQNIIQQLTEISNKQNALQENQHHLQKQNDTLLKKQDELGKKMANMKVLLSRNLGITRGKSKLIFPMKNITELEDVELKLSQEHCEDIKFQMRKLLEGDIKNRMRCIFGDNLILDLNFDGKGNKHALKTYTKFVDILCEETETISRDQKIAELRTAFKLAKGRIHKKKSRVKTKESR